MAEFKLTEEEFQALDPLTKLGYEYDQFIQDNKLPEWSADEIVAEVGLELKPWQRSYLENFIQRWEVAEQ